MLLFSNSLAHGAIITRNCLNRLPPSRCRRLQPVMTSCAQQKTEIVVAIDGPAGGGKGTLARALASKYNLAHLDTGLLYRAVAHQALSHGVSPDDEGGLAQLARSLSAADLSNPLLRADGVASMASKVSALPQVRAALLDWQRSFAAKPPAELSGVVLDGRDIGTVVLPDAPLKLFVTARPEVRAERRYLELLNNGTDVTLAGVLASILERDARDSGRSSAPLRCAEDAHLVDTSDLTLQDVVKAASAFVEKVYLRS